MKKETNMKTFEVDFSSLERKTAPDHLYSRIQAKMENESSLGWNWRVATLGFTIIVVLNIFGIGAYLSKGTNSESDFIYPNISSPKSFSYYED